MAKKKKGADKKGKKPHKNKLTSKKYLLYEVTGDTVKRKNRFSVKAGPGVFMAKHKDRVTCGKTSYTEFGKSEEAQ